MAKHRKRIEEEAARKHALHEAVLATFRRRHESTEVMRAWRQACDRFHRDTSPLDAWLERAQAEDLSADAGLRDFAIAFLETDPMYFASGHAKTRLLRRLKRIAPDEAEARRLAAVVVDAVRRRGRQEIRGYCRLAAALALPGVAEEVRQLAQTCDGAVVSRARMMLRYLGATTDKTSATQ
jgi:hypothetical protein